MTRPLLFVTALLAVAVAGCDGGAGRASPQASASSALTDQQIAAVGLQYSQCLRQHGLPRFPDPQVTDGHLGIGRPSAGYNPKADLMAHPAAAAACRPILDRLPASVKRRQAPTAADLQKLRAYAKCVREHGVPEFPDPDQDGVFKIIGTRLEHEDPAIRLLPAEAACKQFWSGPIRVDGADKGVKK